MKIKTAHVWTLLSIIFIVGIGLYMYSLLCFSPNFSPETGRKERTNHATSFDQPALPDIKKEQAKEKKVHAGKEAQKAEPRAVVTLINAGQVEEDLPGESPEERFAAQAVEIFSVLDAHVKHPGEVWAKIEAPPEGKDDLNEMMEEMANMYRDAVDHDKPVKIVIWAKGRPFMVKTFFGPQIF